MLAMSTSIEKCRYFLKSHKKLQACFDFKAQKSKDIQLFKSPVPFAGSRRQCLGSMCKWTYSWKVGKSYPHISDMLFWDRTQ